MCVVGHSIRQIKQLVLIQLENIFFFTYFFPVSFLIQFIVATEISCVCVTEETAEGQGQVA